MDADVRAARFEELLDRQDILDCLTRFTAEWTASIASCSCLPSTPMRYRCRGLRRRPR